MNLGKPRILILQHLTKYSKHNKIYPIYYLICIKKADVFAHNFRKTYSLNKNTSYICTVKRHFLG